MHTGHTVLARLLAEIDGVIVEARSHVLRPGPDTESRVNAAKVLVDMVELRGEVGLRGE